MEDSTATPSTEQRCDNKGNSKEVFWTTEAISEVKKKSQLQEIKSLNLTYFTIIVLEPQAEKLLIKLVQILLKSSEKQMLNHYMWMLP